MGAFLASAACAALPVTAAQAQIAWTRCGDSNNVACGHLTVPIDPSGAIPGTITLAMRRHRAPLGEAKDAVIALAGGPGQSAIPFLSQFGQILGKIADTRDVIAFDQRGTGLSHPLSCPAFEHLTGGGSPGAVAICAGQIGPTRGLYTTADTVADIEAMTAGELRTEVTVEMNPYFWARMSCAVAVDSHLMKVRSTPRCLLCGLMYMFQPPMLE